MEIFRHNAHNGVRYIVQFDDCIVQFRLEPLSPQPVTDDGNVGGSRLVLAVGEIAACRRWTPSIRKKSAVTRAPSIRSGIVPPVRLNSSEVQADKFSKT